MYFTNNQIAKLAGLQGWKIEWFGNFSGVWRDDEHQDRVFLRPEDYQPHTNSSHTVELINELSAKGWHFHIYIDIAGYNIEVYKPTTNYANDGTSKGKNFSEVICTVILAALDE